MNKRAKDEMTRRVAFVGENDSIQKAYEYMEALEVHHVPVVRGTRVVGMISDRDVLLISHKKAFGLEVPDKKVSEVMGNSVITCPSETSISQVANLMLTYNVHSVPIVGKEEELVGIITSTDLLRLIRDGEWALEARIPFLFERPTSLFAMAG